METTPAHEFGHFMGYNSGSETETRAQEHDPYNGEKNPSMMANWDGGLAGYGVPEASLANRRVYPGTISRIFEGKNLAPGSIIKLGGMTNEIHRKGYK